MKRNCPVCKGEMDRKSTNIRTRKGPIVKFFYWKCPDCGYTTGAETTTPDT